MEMNSRMKEEDGSLASSLSVRRDDNDAEDEARHQHDGTDDEVSRSSMSVAELSRMEDSLMSGQSSNHSEEEERQRTKLEKRASRRTKQKKKKRIVRPPTEIQIRRQKGYNRIKSKKTANLKDLSDAGGSMAYLTRTKLSENVEQQQRLETIARTRENRDHKIGDDVKILSNNKSGNDRIDWNFLENGYTTMPKDEAEKLPYFIHVNSTRNKSSRSYLSDIDALSSSSTAGVLTDVGYNIETNNASCASGGRKRPRSAMEKANQTEFIDTTRAFPLHFHQLNKTMDLHSMIDTATMGSDRMILDHGRNATLLWIRMVANGVLINDHPLCTTPDTTSKERLDNRVKQEEHVLITNISSILMLSKSSDQPHGVFSQVSHGDSSVIAMEEGNVDDCTKRSSVVKHATKQPLFRLMSMVHSLPKVAHRHHFLMKIAQELGTNRRLWENELIDLVASAESNKLLTPQDRVDIKSFLGVNGNVTSPPDWISDPSMSTHPQAFMQRVHLERALVLSYIRQTCMKNGTASCESVNVSIIIEEGEQSVHNYIKGSADDETAKKSIASCADADMSNISIEEGEQSVHHHIEGSADDETATNVTASCESINVSIIMEEGEQINDGETANENYVKVKIEEGEEDTDRTATTLLDETRAFANSLIDEIQSPDLVVLDKYATIIHESDIDTSHIDVAIASFVDHLTLSMARLRQGEQRVESSSYLQRLKDEVNFWHESIESYLTLAMSFTECPVINLYKPRDNALPELAAQAGVIMMEQSYLVNGAIQGCGGRRNKSTPSSLEVKDENNGNHDNEEIGINNNNLLIEGDLLNNLEKEELHRIKLAAVEIAQRGRDRNNNSTAFTPIHLTTGIAMIIEYLTPSAAEILSRHPNPDSSENRTPFDMMRNMLKLIEEDGSLIPSPESVLEVRGFIVNEELIEAILSAAVLFRTCVISDPENIDHWSWYTASLLAVLCISFSNSEDGKSGRPHLEKDFIRARNNAAVAMKDFVRYAQTCNCPMFHLAVVSMLEWKKPILLLYRPQLYNEVGFGLVNYLHAYHTYCWAIKICSKDSLEKVHMLCEANFLPKDAVLDILASFVERDPCERSNWARLVNALGAVDEDRLHSTKENCKWWGEHRMNHWEDQFFHAPPSTTKAMKPEFIDMVSCAVETHVHLTANRLAVNPPDQAPSIPSPKECLDWIWNSHEDVTEIVNHSFIDSLQFPDSTSTSSIDLQQQKDSHSKVHDRLVRNPTCEALCMKIVVASHLLGMRHSFVCNSIWWLAVKVWQSTQANEALKRENRRHNPYTNGLAWLSIYGIDVSCYLDRRISTTLVGQSLIQERWCV